MLNFDPIEAFLGNIFIIVLAVTDFPEPDSPTIASVSPLMISKDMSFTALTTQPSTLNLISAFFKSKSVVLF